MNPDELARRIIARLQGIPTDEQRAFCETYGATADPLGLLIMQQPPPPGVDIAALFGWQAGGLVIVLGDDEGTTEQQKA